MPYRARFIVMFFLAGIGIGAAIVIPLVTKAVIDGPIADSDPRGLLALGLLAIGLGVVEAFLMFLRRWIVSKGTNGVGDRHPAGPVRRSCSGCRLSFHSRWQSGQLLSRIMNDLATMRRFLGFGLLFIVMNVVQIAVVTALLINMYWPLGLVVARLHGADHLDVPAERAGVHAPVAQDPGPGRRRRVAPSRRVRTGCG